MVSSSVTPTVFRLIIVVRGKIAGTGELIAVITALARACSSPFH